MLAMPKGMRLKRYCPNGVRKVVRSRELTSRGTCQKPLLTSSLLNVVAPASCARVLSTFGKGCVSLCTLSLSRRKSTQMRTFPDRLGTTTIPAHQEVAFVDRDMTPSDSMRASSFSTFFRRGIGTLRGVNRANGLASSLNRIVKVSGKVHNPSNTLLCSSVVVSTLASIPNDCMDSW